MSRKTPVIEYLYETHGFDDITLDDIKEAIRATGSTLSDRNPANFFKDYPRNTMSANANWPEKLKEKRITAVSQTGGGNCLRFTKMDAEQYEPFVDPLNPSAATPIVTIDTTKMDEDVLHFASRDESYIAKITEHLSIMTTYLGNLGIESPKHILNGKKGMSEVDMVWVGKVADQKVLISVEIKPEGETITLDQVNNQGRCMLKYSASKGIDSVFVLGVKPVKLENNGVGIYITSSQKITHETNLTFGNDVIYRLDPPIVQIINKK